MKFFDAHTHVHFAAFAGEADAVVRRALDAGVWMITVGTQLDTSRAAVETAHHFAEGVFAAVGLHPIHTDASYHDEAELGGGEAAKAFTGRGEVFDFDAYRSLALDPKTVAIGEFGLDYYRLEEHTKKKQMTAFELQLDLAHEVQKPVMIHCRNAFPDLIAALKNQNDLLRDRDPGIIHFFTGTKDDARELMDLGFAFTFGGAVTFPGKKGAPGAYDEVVRFIPPDRILSETDAPYVAPVPYRGKRNEPAYVVETVKRLAELKGMTADEMRDTIFTNARRVFGIPESQ